MNTVNIVITRQTGYAAEGAVVVADVTAALAAAGPVEEVAIIGGGEIFREAFALADRIYLTEVDGEVDGDTVTVFLDNAVVLDRYRISEKAKVLYVPIKDGQTRIIDLLANNLGSIPPNTALIIVTAGKKRYELHASYDLKTNARIVIQYRE